jgi:DNA-binding XRE family transcriptional regulator
MNRWAGSLPGGPDVTLIEYRAQTGLTLAALARRVGANPHSISAIAHGRRRPSWKLAGRIEAATHGAVSRAEFFPTTSLPAAAAATPGMPLGPQSAGEAVDQAGDQARAGNLNSTSREESLDGAASLVADRVDGNGCDYAADNECNQTDNNQTSDTARSDAATERGT